MIASRAPDAVSWRRTRFVPLGGSISCVRVMRDHLSRSFAAIIEYYAEERERTISMEDRDMRARYFVMGGILRSGEEAVPFEAAYEL